MKQYWVVKFDCYDQYEQKLQKLLNDAAKEGWELKIIFHQTENAYADAILERDA